VMFVLSLAGPDLVEIFRRVQRVLLPDVGLPTSLYVSAGGNKKVTAD
jgi:hypothetical protein